MAAISDHRVSFEQMMPLGPSRGDVRGASDPDDELEGTPTRGVTPAQALAGRTGYRSDFIEEFPIALPSASKWARDIAPVADRSDGILPYTHFSLMISKSRRLALFAAVNVDGKRAMKIKRTHDRWLYDGRLERSHQVGNELYVSTPLDRGHLVRREDPVWGPDAETANADTFHFTNCAPQHEDLNERIWLGLENYILANVRADKMRVSVFTGPVLAKNDPSFRGVKIPRRFWKVVAFLLPDGRRSATGYMISQAGMITDLEYVFGAYKTFQIPITMIEKVTGLNFGELSAYDGFSSKQESVARPFAVEVRDWGDIRV